jgi:glycosyltransferase involved in cell wall biosynthesis
VGHDLLPELYSGADIFVFPSITDTFGMVMLEAQACGLPAVVSDIGGPQEIIRDGVTGYIAPHDNMEEWMRIVGRVIDMVEQNPEQYRSMREQSRRNAVERFDWNTVIAGITGEYTDPAAGKAAPTAIPEPVA